MRQNKPVCNFTGCRSDGGRTEGRKVAEAELVRTDGGANERDWSMG